MRISELAERSGVPLATVKYYLREGLLPAGRATAATRAEYDEGHVRRLRVIRALIETVGLSVARARDVLRVIDDPGPDVFEAFGRALGALPPIAPVRDAYPRARAVLEQLDIDADTPDAAVAQLEAALEAAEAAGLPADGERLAVYGAAARQVAGYDIAHLPADARAAVEYAVLGTALYEPVLAALRRLAHHDLARAAQPSGTNTYLPGAPPANSR